MLKRLSHRQSYTLAAHRGAAKAIMDTCGIGLVTEDRREVEYVLHETNPAAICLESGQIQRPLTLWCITKAQRDSSRLMTVSAACHSIAFGHIVSSAAGDVLPVQPEKKIYFALDFKGGDLNYRFPFISR